MDVKEIYERAVNGEKLSGEDFEILKANFDEDFILKLIVERFTKAVEDFFESESKGEIQGFDGLLSEFN